MEVITLSLSNLIKGKEAGLLPVAIIIFFDSKSPRRPARYRVGLCPSHLPIRETFSLREGKCICYGKNDRL